MPGSAHPIHRKPVTDTELVEEGLCLFPKSRTRSQVAIIPFHVPWLTWELRFLQKELCDSGLCVHFCFTSPVDPYCLWHSFDWSVIWYFSGNFNDGKICFIASIVVTLLGSWNSWEKKLKTRLNIMLLSIEEVNDFVALVSRDLVRLTTPLPPFIEIIAIRA